MNNLYPYLGLENVYSISFFTQFNTTYHGMEEFFIVDMTS